MAPRPLTIPRKNASQQRSRATVEALIEATARVLVQGGFDVPVNSIDPCDPAVLLDPCGADAALREMGPVRRLERYGVCRYASTPYLIPKALGHHPAAFT